MLQFDVSKTDGGHQNFFRFGPQGRNLPVTRGVWFNRREDAGHRVVVRVNLEFRPSIQVEPARCGHFNARNSSLSASFWSRIQWVLHKYQANRVPLLRRESSVKDSVQALPDQQKVEAGA